MELLSSHQVTGESHGSLIQLSASYSLCRHSIRAVFVPQQPPLLTPYKTPFVRPLLIYMSEPNFFQLVALIVGRKKRYQLIFQFKNLQPLASFLTSLSTSCTFSLEYLKADSSCPPSYFSQTQSQGATVECSVPERQEPSFSDSLFTMSLTLGNEEEG